MVTNAQLIAQGQAQFLKAWEKVFKLYPNKIDLMELRSVFPGLAVTLDETGKRLLFYPEWVDPVPPTNPPTDPPVIPPVIITPGDPTTEPPSDVIWKTLTKDYPGQMLGGGIGLPGNWWPGATQPWKIPTDKYTGVFKGLDLGGATDQTGHSGTLWAARTYDTYGEINDLELWGIGDFYKGKEGHGLYMNVVPHLDLTIRNLKVRKIGAQAIQREWRAHETNLPLSMWENGGGTFILDGADLQETGLIDEGTGGAAVRASWAITLCNTMQRTIVRNVTHINYHSPKPHEGSIWLGPGQDGYTSPYNLVEDCKLWTESHDRAEIFVAKSLETILRRIDFGGAANYIAIADDNKKVVISDMPKDIEVRIQPKEKYHGPPKEIYIIKAGTTKEFNF